MRGELARIPNIRLLEHGWNELARTPNIGLYIGVH